LYLIICTAGKFQKILLHVVRASSEKSAIIAILGGIVGSLLVVAKKTDLRVWKYTYQVDLHV